MTIRGGTLARTVFGCMLNQQRERLFTLQVMNGVGVGREAGPPNHHDDEVDSDQKVVNKELSLGVGRASL